ncbi:MAG: hypothetical protein AAGA44_09090 [Pseudomonadota bacterium]
MLRITFIWVLALPITALGSDVAEYSVSVDSELTTLTIEARFDTPQSTIRARSYEALRYLETAIDCESQTPIRASGRQFRLPSGGTRCLRYTVDLSAAAADDRRNSVLSTRNVLVSPRHWLWRPSLTDTQSIIIGFDLPEGMNVSVPWTPTADGRLRLSSSPGSGSAVTVFGDFPLLTRPAGNTRLRIALLSARNPYDAEAFADWLGSTADNILQAYGRFPSPEPQIIVVPVGDTGWSSQKAVPFGRVLRDGGEAVELFINEHVVIEEFYRDWTATHEFSHLMLPYVTIRQRWVSEGFAQYYQNVLLARAGVYDERLAWQKIYEGLERGRRSGPGLSPNESSRGNRRRALMKMYWSGAVVALKADVELRRRSGGKETLDSVLGRLERCCLPSGRVWQAEELFEQLDALLEEPLFVPLYRRYADAPGFPSYDDLLVRLGVSIRRDTVSLNDAAIWANVRRAITEPAVQTATLPLASPPSSPP